MAGTFGSPRAALPLAPLSPTWESFVVTGKARSRIRRYIRSQESDEYTKLGTAILERAFEDEGYKFTNKAIRNVLKVFKQTKVKDLFAKVGAGVLTGPGGRRADGPKTGHALTFILDHLNRADQVHLGTTTFLSI